MLLKFFNALAFLVSYSLNFFCTFRQKLRSQRYRHITNGWLIGVIVISSLITPPGPDQVTLAATSSSTSQSASYIIKYLAPNSAVLNGQMRQAIATAMNNWKNSPPKNNTFFLIDLRAEKNWAIATLTTADLDSPLKSGEESPLGSDNLFSLLLVSIKGNWQAALDSDPKLQSLLKEIPEAELSKAARQAIFPDPNTQPPIRTAQAYNNYRFPWRPGVRSYVTTGWHDGTFGGRFPTNTSIDFDINSPGNGDVIAAASGTIIYKCSATYNVLLQIKTDNTNESLGYLHIDPNTLPVKNGHRLAVGDHVDQAEFLGVPVEGSVSDTCGTSTGSHIHMYFPTKPFTIDCITFTDTNDHYHEYFYSYNSGCGFTVGQGSGFQPAYQAAYNRMGGQAILGLPTAGVSWYNNPGTTWQPLNGGAGGPNAIFHNESAGGSNIRAFEVQGGIYNAYMGLGGPTSSLGTPTSDFFTNPGGRAQNNFANGYMVWDENGVSGPTSHQWPTDFSGWKAQYFNSPILGSGPSWVRNEGDASTLNFGYNWSINPPIPDEGLTFPDYWSARWERNYTFEAGTYKFSLCGDDNLKLYLLGVTSNPLIDVSVGCGEYTQSFGAGASVLLRIDFVQGSGAASIGFTVTKLTDAQFTTSSNHLMPVADGYKVSMIPGQQQTHSITTTNSGTVNWVDGGTNPPNYRFGIHPTFFGFTRSFLNNGEQVVPGGSKEWPFTLAIPSNQAPGSYYSTLQMLNENVTWFGPTKNLYVNVDLPLENNLARGKQVTASSVYGPGFEGGGVNDGNPNSRWASAPDDANPTITVDLGGNYNLDRLKIYWERYFPTNYSVKFLNTNGIWQDGFVVSNGDMGLKSFQFAPSTIASKLQISAQLPTIGHISIWELEVFGSALTGGLVVTNPNDRGIQLDSAVQGTLSYALTNATSGQTISFTGVSNIKVVGTLPPVQSGVAINGSSCTSPIVIDGSGAPNGTNGLVLSGNNYLYGLKIVKFSGIQIKNIGSGNHLTCVSASKS